MSEQNREFKGIWIPKEVWLDTRLNALDKIIFAEIDSYSSTENGCFAGNGYLASFCQCSESKISKTISKLIDFGYIKRVSFDGRYRVLQSCLVNFTTLNSKNCESTEHNLPYINKDINKAINIDNNVSYNQKCDEKTDPQKEHHEEFLKELETKPKALSENDVYCSEVVEKFASICKDLPKLRKLTPKRKRAILKAKKDIEEFGGWEKFFSCIASSRFLNGQNKDGWKAQFDWILKPDNMVKIMEGNYQNNFLSKENEIPSEDDYDVNILFR